MKRVLIVFSLFSILSLVAGYVYGCIEDSACQDNLWCTGHEYCVYYDPDGICFAGIPPCEDYDECSLNVCIEADPPGEFRTGMCYYPCNSGGLTGLGDPCCSNPLCSDDPLCSEGVAVYWDIEIVDTLGDVGWNCSLDLDNSNNPHIGYFDNTNDDLKYAYHDGSSWHIEVVDANGGSGSIALDSNDNPHISYGTNDTLKYAYYDGSNWQIDVVDASDLLWDISLDLDSGDKPHISYGDVTNKELKYAYHDGSSWHIEVVDLSSGNLGETYLKLDANDNPHISYRDLTNLKRTLKYACHNGSSWHIEVIDENANVWTTSLALDNNNNPHIFYASSSGVTYAYHDGSGWTIEVVDTNFGMGSIALDSHDNPHISYESNGDLKYAYYDGTNWIIKRVDVEGDVGPFNSLALDNNNYAHISYLDFINKDLKYARMSDTDDDSISDGEDNCPEMPNGPDLGTCTTGASYKIARPCMSDSECGAEGFCSMNQEDTDEDGIGDACDLCEGDLDCNNRCDALDVEIFLEHFGRSQYNRPCTNADLCPGDFLCDEAVDALDVNKFLEDFGRSTFFNPCPPCVAGPWCVYP